MLGPGARVIPSELSYQRKELFASSASWAKFLDRRMFPNQTSHCVFVVSRPVMKRLNAVYDKLLGGGCFEDFRRCFGSMNENIFNILKYIKLEDTYTLFLYMYI